jgi:hypothetical protein
MTIHNTAFFQHRSVWHLFVTFCPLTDDSWRPLPGDPGEKACDVCDAFIIRHGLDKPARTVWHLCQEIRKDFGSSIRYNKPITDLLAEQHPPQLN